MIITQTLVDGVWVTQDPTDGQPYRKLMDGFAFETGTHSVVPADEEAREWRDHELSATDFIVPLSDHPQRDAYILYRQSLRAWPSTSDFPATRPELGE
tara:strand:- start:52 stop:345 length:294 start_codon:yes stop_codon:yes gene_type:complete